MKKFKPVFFLLFICFAFLNNNAKADIVFTSTPDTTAFVGELYSYQITTAYDGSAPTFSLVEKPTGMTIGASSGLITWTPGSITLGGRVVVKATNTTTPEKFHTYFVYLTDAIECPSGLISYWKLDETEGPVYSDFKSGFNAHHGGSDFTLYDTVGVVDNAQRFKPLSQTDQFLVVNEAENFNWSQEDTFAISLWFKWDGTKHPSKNQMFVGRSDGINMIAFGIRYFGTADQPVEPRVMFRVQDYKFDPDGLNPDDHMKEVSTDGAFTLNTGWHHVVAEFIGKPNGQTQTLNLYYDKVNVGGDAQYFSNFQMDDSIKLYMGYWNAFGVNVRDPFSGYMDEIAIYKKALGTSGVTKIYNDGIARKPHCQPGNYAPVITSVPVTSVNEDTPYSYTLTYREIDAGDVVTRSAKILPKWLSFNTSTGALTGTPLNKNVGDTIVRLAINDGKVEIVQTFTLTVVNVNDPPVIKSTAPTAVNENVLYTYTIVAEDVDAGDQITLSIQGTKPSWLTFVDNGNGTGVLSGTPTNDAVGFDPFRDYNIVIRATDKAAAYAEQSFVIRVTNINDAPVITGQNPVSTDEDVPVTITFAHLNVTDVDNVYPDDFTLTVHNGTNYTRVGNTITPALNFHGTLTVPVTISDGDSSKNFNLTVTVNPVNDPPVFITTPGTTAKENVAYSYVFIATDVDDATLQYSYDKKPSWLTFSSTTSGGSLFGTPDNSDIGTDSVVIKVTDTKAIVYQKFTITVAPATGINDYSSNNSLISNLYPMPADNEFTVEFSDSKSGIFQLIDLNGRLLRNIEINNQNRIIVDVSDLRPNVYIIKLIKGSEVQLGKIVVE